MLLKYFYDNALAHASYLVGCQKTGEAILIDPGRDIGNYLESAKQNSMRLVAVAETHIHADYVSGIRELADHCDVKIFASNTGPDEWKYQYLDGYPHQLLTGGDEFSVGNINFNTMATPGHTPESISLILTDAGGGASRPMGIFSGDFVFVGSIGRPDLLEEAAGVTGSAEIGARQLYQSIESFKRLPDYLQVWPAHGAGSACGKGLGAIPSTTVGYEKLFNAALQFETESEFVDYVLADQPAAPKYFAKMKQVNKVGPKVLGVDSVPQKLPVAELNSLLNDKRAILDLSPSKLFAQSHVRGAWNIPVGMLAGWAGWIVDYDNPLYLIADPSAIREANRVLRKIGVENIPGYFSTEDVATAIENGDLPSDSFDYVQPGEISEKIQEQSVELIDVRSDAEWSKSRIPGARHLFLGRLPEKMELVSKEKTIVVQCLSGGRSAIGASILQAAGYDVMNLSGGFRAWCNTGLPTIEEQQTTDAVV